LTLLWHRFNRFSGTNTPAVPNGSTSFPNILTAASDQPTNKDQPMITANPISPLKIMTRSEVAAILSEQSRRAKRSIGSMMNLIIFRLATCAGLRVSEIAGLTLSNVRSGQSKPHLAVPSSLGKRAKARVVPLWIDARTLTDIRAWECLRQLRGATGSDPVICNLRGRDFGKPITARAIEYRFKTVLRNALEPQRATQLSIHSGRHTFASNLLACGFSLTEARDWLGHGNIATTSCYLHCDPTAGETILDSFNF